MSRLKHSDHGASDPLAPRGGPEPGLTCHGSSLQPELKAEILCLYPNDQATGFKPGELRGAFTVTEAEMSVAVTGPNVT